MHVTITPANQARADRVRDIVTPFQSEQDAEENATDLLTNLMHWCDADGLSFSWLLSRARDHYAAEQTEE